MPAELERTPGAMGRLDEARQWIETFRMWERRLDGLERYVSTRAGRRGATRVSPDIRLQRWFEAAPDVVFDAYTDPDAQRDLRAGGGDWVVESECDLRVGGEWIIRFGPSSAPYVERNVFDTVERPHRLVYASTTEWPDGSHVESLREISLHWLDGRTLLTLEQRGVPSGDVERGFTEGWNEFLDGLVARIQTGLAI